MDQNTRRHIANSLRVVAKQLRASVDEKAEFEKATKEMERALAAFKQKPTDKAYLAAVDAMKDFRKWAFEAYYKNAPADSIPEKRGAEQGGPPAGVGERRAKPNVAASASDDFLKAHDIWMKTGKYRPLVAVVMGKTSPVVAAAKTSPAIKLDQTRRARDAAERECPHWDMEGEGEGERQDCCYELADANEKYRQAIKEYRAANPKS